MKKIFATAVATTLIAVASVAATTAPASAGKFSIHIGGFGYGGYGGYGYGYGYAPVYVAPAPVYVAPAPYYGNNWSAHQSWCSAQYVTYNPTTDLYFYAPGKQKHCNSPYN